MIDCLADTGAEPLVPLVIGGVIIVLGVLAVCFLRRAGSRGAAALLLLAAIGIGSGLVLTGPAGSASAASCPTASPTAAPTTSATSSPAPAPVPEPEPPTVPVALVPTWAPSTLSLQASGAGSTPTGTSQLTILNNTGSTVTDLTVTLTNVPAPSGSVLVQDSATGEGWDVVSGGGGSMTLSWTGTLETGHITPATTLLFSTDDPSGSGTVVFSAHATSGAEPFVDATIVISYGKP